MRFEVTGQAYTRSRYGSSLYTEGESEFWQVLDTFIGVQPGYVHSGVGMNPDKNGQPYTKSSVRAQQCCAPTNDERASFLDAVIDEIQGQSNRSTATRKPSLRVSLWEKVVRFCRFKNEADTLLSYVKQPQHLSQLLYSDFLFVAVQLRLSVG
ncbi:hypothetical protein PI95_025000 [Hassallia byssoidea VB512170]|uniref:Uncharacterized protein n=1 Tax=Hassallia byssoidea VB512170 TaxID=1304833 RepID=A0A846HDT3_9CYAN|nr:hypothetical protein [Hassalia byssoidea]NEU75727.1 hypothetical protein [Hassalia byssoidea VB512170]